MSIEQHPAQVPTFDVRLSHTRSGKLDYATCRQADNFDISTSLGIRQDLFMERQPTEFRPGATIMRQQGRFYIVQARYYVNANVELPARWPACLLARPTLLCIQQNQSAGWDPFVTLDRSMPRCQDSGCPAAVSHATLKDLKDHGAR